MFLAFVQLVSQISRASRCAAGTPVALIFVWVVVKTPRQTALAARLSSSDIRLRDLQSTRHAEVLSYFSKLFGVFSNFLKDFLNVRTPPTFR